MASSAPRPDLVWPHSRLETPARTSAGSPGSPPVRHSCSTQHRLYRSHRAVAAAAGWSHRQPRPAALSASPAGTAQPGPRIHSNWASLAWLGLTSCTAWLVTLQCRNCRLCRKLSASVICRRGECEIQAAVPARLPGPPAHHVSQSR